MMEDPDVVLEDLLLEVKQPRRGRALEALDALRGELRETSMQRSAIERERDEYRRMNISLTLAIQAHHANVWANCAICNSAVGTQRPPKDDLRGLWPTDAVPGAAHVHYATEPEETP